MNHQELARTALRCSLESRQTAKVQLDAPICIYDFVEKLDAEVWFVGGASFAGMYAKDFGRIFVPAERPAGRRAFTCAHELAHFLFNHGSRVEDLDFDRADNELPEEVLANTFAAFLLMPRQAVFRVFHRRNLAPASASPLDIFAAASQLGVGYDTLLKHLRFSLNLIDHARMENLAAIQPKEIRRMILGTSSSCHLVLADNQWEGVAIDLEVGDFAVVPSQLRVRGNSVREVGQCAKGIILEGVRPGLAQAQSNHTDWAAMIRVSKKQFTGRGAYRHLEDPDYE